MKVSRKILLFILILSGSIAPRCGATVYHSDGSAANVQALYNDSAQNGDTITLPAGTFTWSTPVTISKAITLQGQGVGTTVIRDAVQSEALIEWNLVANRASRMTGIEFQNGGRTSQNQNGIIPIDGIAYDDRTMRIDHCKFDHLNGTLLVPNDVIGVIDHNLFLEPANEAIQVWNAKWGGRTFGDGSWTDTNHFGTSQFLFIEDNTFNGGPGIDAYAGARYVARHNTFVHSKHGGHGTESSGRNRGMRAIESYNNSFIGDGNGGILIDIRSGVAVVHDNTVSGGTPGLTRRFKLACHRVFHAFNFWGGADGQSPWDVNQANAPFYSGTATSGPTLAVTVAGAGWTPGQWVGWSIVKTSNLGENNFSMITANTSNTITFLSTGGYGANLSFASGDTFSIYKVNQALDQPGRSGGSLISGYPPVPPPGWDDQVTDPCYEWNNVDSSNGSNELIHFASPHVVVRINEHYFNNTQLPGYTPYVYPHPLVTGVPKAVVTDFNGDGSPDFVLYNASTHQTAIWYLNNNVLIGGDAGPTLPPNWGLATSADFDLDGHADFALFNPVLKLTAIWYMSGPTLISGAGGPTLPPDWELVGAADFNHDSHSDYVLYNASTGQTAIWYLINHLLIGGDVGPTLPNGWRFVGVADFDRDGHPDYLLFHPITGETAIWYLSGPTLIGSAFGPTVASGWVLVATADFDGDGSPDFLLYNPGTHETAIWYLSNNVFVSSAYGPTLPAAWSWTAP